MSALSSVWQDSDDSLCNHFGCGKDVCLRVVVGTLDLRTGREGGRCSDDDLPPTSSK